MTEELTGEFVTNPEKISGEFVRFISAEDNPPSIPTYVFNDQGGDMTLIATEDHAEGAMDILEKAFKTTLLETPDITQAQSNVLGRANLRTIMLAIKKFGPTLRGLKISDERVTRLGLGKAFYSETAKFGKELFAVELGMTPEHIPGLLPKDHTETNLRRGYVTLSILNSNIQRKRASDHSRARRS